MLNIYMAIRKVIACVVSSLSLVLTASVFAQSAPLNLQATCNSAGTQVSVSWSQVAGATAYAPRLNYLANDSPACQDGWLCAGDSRDWYSNNYTATNTVASIETNQPYSFWVHTLQGGNVGSPSTITFTCSAIPSTIQICITPNGPVFANNTGADNASPKIQECLNTAVLTGGVWEIPKGVYRLQTALSISRPMVWRSQGTAGTATCVYNDSVGASCAVLKADANIAGTDAKNTMLLIQNVNNVTLDHLIIDGNRVERVGNPVSEPGASYCDSVQDGNYTGSNILFNVSNGSTVSSSVTRNAVCGSAMVFIGNNASINNTYFYANGNRSNGLNGRWADGLTLLSCNDCAVYNNNFTNNTDVALVFGNGQRTSIYNNQFQQWDQNVFAAMAFSNFQGSGLGNFVGTNFQGNTIACGAQKCIFGINVGEYAWYPLKPDGTPTPRTEGGNITDNSVSGATVGIHINGAGSGLAGDPNQIRVYGNTVSGSPANADVRACANQAVGNKVYWLANSSVDTAGENDYVSTTNLTGCIR
jgi:hypothetical protein